MALGLQSILGVIIWAKIPLDQIGFRTRGLVLRLFVRRPGSGPSSFRSLQFLLLSRVQCLIQKRVEQTTAGIVGGGKARLQSIAYGHQLVDLSDDAALFSERWKERLAEFVRSVRKVSRPTGDTIELFGCSLGFLETGRPNNSTQHSTQHWKGRE